MPDVCRVEDGRLVFKLDLRWTKEQKLGVAKQYALDSAVMANAFANKPAFTMNGIDWKVRKLNKDFIELYKDLLQKTSTPLSVNDVIMMDDSWINFTDAEERQSVPYGINMFTRFNVFKYSKETAWFYLPGYKNAKEVFLAGSFNNWSTSQQPMYRSDSGWSVRIKLKPGKYSYKYIIDGHWITDPFNKQGEDDTYGGVNSVLFCYNYSFVLYGHQEYKKVIVSGSFNEWNEKELKMFRTQKGWVFPMYLREGMHAYKFLVDGEWILDPGNKMKLRNEEGNFNSIVGIGEKMYFRLTGFPKAEKIFVSGSFNDWHTDELEMEKIDGGWQLPYILAPGNYEYKFIVDGYWITDPENSARTGSGGYMNSILAIKPNHTFVLDHYPDAESVIVTGTFNGWRKDGYQMVKGEGKWYLPLNLKPGKTLYKFIVDGTWIRDPDNDLWENNAEGTGNSVLWIKTQSYN
jgi:hypothetical protein